jgi:hypothetical protein
MLTLMFVERQHLSKLLLLQRTLLVIMLLRVVGCNLLLNLEPEPQTLNSFRVPVVDLIRV